MNLEEMRKAAKIFDNEDNDEKRQKWVSFYPGKGMIQICCEPIESGLRELFGPPTPGGGMIFKGVDIWDPCHYCPFCGEKILIKAEDRVFKK